jgi:hypothetical protein
MQGRRRGAATAVAVLVALTLAACSAPASVVVPSGEASLPLDERTSPAATTTAPATVPATVPPTAPTTPVPAPVTPSTNAPVPAGGATDAPSWLGRRVLPLRKDGYGRIGPTPPDLDPRNIRTVDVLSPPADGAFRSTVAAVPPDVVARSTWGPDCPVRLEDLRYVTVSFVGFDGGVHTGELIVNKAAAEPMVRVFRKLFAARFPIERMVVTTALERDMPPTGDGNTTGSFNCRSAAGTTHWSQHAYGLAVDVNPFMNPYLKGDVVLPELATTYGRRGDVRPGMITRGGAVAKAFAAEGWGWGGNWTSLKDYMHFSRNGT